MIKKPSYEELEIRIKELETKQSEQEDLQFAKKNSEIFFRKLFEDHSAVMLLIEPDTGQIVMANLAAAAFYGYPRADLLQMNISQLNVLHPEQINEKMQYALKKQDNVFEFQHSFANGQIRDVEVHSSPVSIQQRTLLFSIVRDITERKLAEKALKESEERFSLAMEASKDGVYEWDLETREIYYSPGWKRMLGYEPDELPDDFSVWENFTKPEDVKKSWQIMQELIEGKRDRFEVEFAMRHKDGHWVHILSRSNLYKDSKGKPVRVIGTHVDISESKKQRDHLRLSETRFRKAQELGKVGNWEYNLEADEFWGSEEAKKIYGFNPEKDNFSTEEVESCIVERNRVHQALVDLIEKRKPYDIEFEIIARKTGEKKHIVSVAELEFNEENKPRRVSGVIQDITQNKKAKIALENEQRFLAAIFDNIGDSVIVCDENGLLVRFNEEARKLHGLPEKPIKPDQWSEYYNLFRKDGVTPLPVEEIPLFRALKGELVRDAEIVVIPHGKSPCYLVCNAQRLIDSNGRVFGAVTAMHDVTGRKLYELEKEKLHDQLGHARKMEAVGRLAGGVAHDFNNMLSVIIGHAEMALAKTSQSTPLASDLTEIKNAAERSADLTRQLLTFARKQTVAPKVLDLNETVGGMIKMLQRIIGEDIDLAWKPGENVWLIKMDPTQLDQILANLCVNARDAIDNVGKIKIETNNAVFEKADCKDQIGTLPGEFVLLSVSDNGCGMAPETLCNIFEPFFTTKKMGKGTGLGLATVYGVIQQNNGFILVDSEPGKGTTFKIYLPRHSSNMVQTLGTVIENKTVRGHETILLVEDELSILKMTTLMLEHLGYKVLPAPSPDDAIRIANEFGAEIHLLITDVVMPGMNGRDLARKILVLRPELKRLFMSGYTADVIANRGILDEGVNFLQKPFSISRLSNKLREVLTSSK